MTIVPADFDARFSALWRRYSYRVTFDPAAQARLERHLVLGWNRPLDIERMNRAADTLIGEHDFTAFCRVPGVRVDGARAPRPALA